ncbi:hypothetical protein AB6A40_006194 [Gnathostoma spinigerum]|uniref:Uncharacterized protein n=1 Tax=Gnathostoma spinigerum TaxID=75299 RepID=A0ABD6ETA8_9BILA
MLPILSALVSEEITVLSFQRTLRSCQEKKTQPAPVRMRDLKRHHIEAVRRGRSTTAALCADDEQRVKNNLSAVATHDIIHCFVFFVSLRLKALTSHYGYKTYGHQTFTILVCFETQTGM